MDRITIRPATGQDVMQISEIITEDWRLAYRGIIDDGFLNSLSVEDRYRRELPRYDKYIVAAENDKVLGLAWLELSAEDGADCEIIALYVRYGLRNSGVGRALMANAVGQFKNAGKKKMIIWCLRDNAEARGFYEKMGGRVFKDGAHCWGDREYPMISYIYDLDEIL